MEMSQELGGIWPLLLNAGKALAVIIIGWMVASWAGSTVRKRLNSIDQMDATLSNFLASMAKWAVLLIVLVMGVTIRDGVVGPVVFCYGFVFFEWLLYAVRRGASRRGNGAPAAEELEEVSNHGW